MDEKNTKKNMFLTDKIAAARKAFWAGYFIS